MYIFYTYISKTNEMYVNLLCHICHNIPPLCEVYSTSILFNERDDSEKKRKKFTFKFFSFYFFSLSLSHTSNSFTFYVYNPHSPHHSYVHTIKEIQKDFFFTLIED